MSKTIKWIDDLYDVSITAKNDPQTIGDVYEFLIKPLLLSIGYSEQLIDETFGE